MGYNIHWEEPSSNPQKIALFFEGELWKELPKKRYNRRLKELLPVGNPQEFQAKFLDLEKKLAKGSAIYLLGKKSYLIDELHQKLLRLDYSIKASSYAIEECCRMGYLKDDEILPLMFDQFLRRGYGPKKIREKLLQKRVGLEKIDLLIQKVYPRDKQQEILALLIQKSNKEKEKLFRFLLGRGFDYEIIYEMVFNNH